MDEGMKALERVKPELPQGIRAAGGGGGRRRGPVRIAVRIVLLLFLAVAAAGVAGFLYFAEMVAGLSVPDDPRADAIVVLTGGYQRIDHAIGLLERKAGERLLISGVNPATSGNQIQRLTQSSPELFTCCVDMGYDAMDTIGNANETARWISDHGFRRVLVVTNDYHMPRSPLELKLSDRRTDFVAYPVVNSDLRNGNWLSRPGILRALLSEYIKYGVARLRAIAGARTATGLRGDLSGG
jgi:uncharacterized SAM-binding protein YcdF (DUF218 family)